MAQLNVNYPHGLDDNALQAAVAEYAQALFQAGGHPNAVLQYAPLMQLGQFERQMRAADRSSRLTKRVSYISLALGVIALLVSVLNTLSSDRWEDRQLDAIGQTHSHLSDILAEQQKTTTAVDEIPKKVGTAIAAAIPKRSAKASRP